MTIGISFPVVVEAARTGDKQAIERLYRAYNPSLLRFMGARIADHATDVAQETWLSVASSLPNFEGDEARFRSWFFTIAHRRLIDHRRRMGRHLETASDPDRLDAVSSPVDDEHGSLMEASVRALVASLSPVQADVVLLRIIGGLEVDEVARIVGKSPGAVRVMQHRALKALAERFQTEAAAS
jgi:RNA polymerase sigma-70 factor (ECF subfamily)